MLQRQEVSGAAELNVGQEKENSKEGDICYLFSSDDLLGFDEEIYRSDEPYAQSDGEQPDLSEPHRAQTASAFKG